MLPGFSRRDKSCRYLEFPNHYHGLSSRPWRHTLDVVRNELVVEARTQPTFFIQGSDVPCIDPTWFRAFWNIWSHGSSISRSNQCFNQHNAHGNGKAPLSPSTARLLEVLITKLLLHKFPPLLLGFATSFYLQFSSQEKHGNRVTLSAW